jgi:hypothetical protein
MLTRKNASFLLIAALAASSANLQAQEPDLPLTPYMGGPVELVEAPNGAIANKHLLDGIDKVTWTRPTIEQPVEGIWVFGGYALAPISIIDTDEGLIAFDTGDTKHDGEILLEAIRTVSEKPIKSITYGHSHTVFGAEVLAEGVRISRSSTTRTSMPWSRRI